MGAPYLEGWDSQHDESSSARPSGPSGKGLTIDVKSIPEDEESSSPPYSPSNLVPINPEGPAATKFSLAAINTTECQECGVAINNPIGFKPLEIW